MRLLIQVTSELGSVDEVAVVSEADAVRRVDIEWLRLSVRTATGSRVSEVAKTHVARKVAHALAVVENFGSKTVAFALENLTTERAGRDTAGILSTVLEVVQRLQVLAEICSWKGFTRRTLVYLGCCICPGRGEY